MAMRFERHQGLAIPFEPCRSGHIVKDFDPVRIAEVEFVADQGHAKGLVLVLHKHMPRFGDPVAILVPKQRDTVGTFADGFDTAHGRLRGVIHKRLWRTGLFL